MTGLDREIQALCEAIAAEPTDAAESLRPRLDTLLAGIDRLQALLRDQFEGVQAELQAHGRRSQANRAYAQRMPAKPSKDV